MIQLRNGRFIWIDLRIELQYAAGLPFLVENRPPPPRPTSPRPQIQRESNGSLKQMDSHMWRFLSLRNPAFFWGGWLVARGIQFGIRLAIYHRVLLS